MRAGLFGGTFNPIHKGHLMAAEQVLQRFALDRLYIVPCRVPPHKLPAYLAPAAHRVRMIQLALPSDGRCRLSDVEIQRSGPSYTIDTVAHFAARIIPGASIYLVMGMDAFFGDSYLETPAGVVGTGTAGGRDPMSGRGATHRRRGPADGRLYPLSLVRRL